MSDVLGIYRVIRNFLSVNDCNDLINSLPNNTNTPSDNYSTLPVGAWYSNQITDQRCALALDNDILTRILTVVPDDLNYVADRMYVTKYDAGQLCKAHTDPADITVIVLLNNSFTDGELVIGKRKIKLDVGDAVVFSDRLMHSVTEVTTGTRYAVSVWLNIKSN